VNLHYILSKSSVKTRPSVLWCYKDELGFSSHRKKRINQIKAMKKKGLLDPEKDDPFELFVASTKIRYCYYKVTFSLRKPHSQRQHFAARRCLFLFLEA